jgi:phosphoglycolate phosphatase
LSRYDFRIFDLDGTLVDSREDLHASMNAALRGLGLPERSLAEISSYVGEGARRLVERAVLPRVDCIDQATALFFAHYEAHLVDRTRAYPGVAELLAKLEGPLAVATNKPGKFARPILAKLGLLDRFVAVLGADEGPRKPDPGLVDRLRALVGVSAERTVLVGDSRIDAETARNAGVALVLVSWGFGSRAELEATGGRIVDTAAELGSLLTS